MTQVYQVRWVKVQDVCLWTVVNVQLRLWGVIVAVDDRLIACDVSLYDLIKAICCNLRHHKQENPQKHKNSV